MTACEQKSARPGCKRLKHKTSPNKACTYRVIVHESCITGMRRALSTSRYNVVGFVPRIHFHEQFIFRQATVSAATYLSTQQSDYESVQRMIVNQSQMIRSNELIIFIVKVETYLRPIHFPNSRDVVHFVDIIFVRKPFLFQWIIASMTGIFSSAFILHDGVLLFTTSHNCPRVGY